MVNHDVCRSTRYVRGVRGNQRAVNVIVDPARRPNELVMMKARMRRREKHAAVLVLGRADPVSHRDRVRVLTLNLKIDLGLRVVDETETCRDLT